jgi:hypothetical protein
MVQQLIAYKIEKSESFRLSDFSIQKALSQFQPGSLTDLHCTAVVDVCVTVVAVSNSLIAHTFDIISVSVWFLHIDEEFQVISIPRRFDGT